MRLSDLQINNLTEDDKYYLVMSGIKDFSKNAAKYDEKSDLLVVLGCSPIPLEARVKKLMELVKAGYGNNVLLSGGTGWHNLYQYKDEETGEIKIDEEKQQNLIKAIKLTIGSNLLGDNPSEKEISIYNRFVEGMDQIGHEEHVKAYGLTQDEKKLNMTEAEFMKLILLTNGGLENVHFLHEPFSNNTQENMQNTKKTIETAIARGELNSLNRIIVVTSSFHCRRAWLTFKKLFPSLDIVVCPATEDLEKRGVELGKDMMSNEYYKKQIDKECDAIINYSKNGSIYDANFGDFMDDKSAIKQIEMHQEEYSL